MSDPTPLESAQRALRSLGDLSMEPSPSHVELRVQTALSMAQACALVSIAESLAVLAAPKTTVTRDGITTSFASGDFDTPL